jgi:ATP-dependent HslUV protease subunit HslV
MLRQLEALLIVADRTTSLLISGTGDLISPEEGVLAIGSGGSFALAAARALIMHRADMTAAQIAREALQIAAGIDIYTNDHLTVEEL